MTKTYTRGQAPVTALWQVDLDIERGEFLAIHGRSGSGKTTLLSLIGGLDRRTAGEVEVDGVALSSMNDARLSAFRNRTIGFIFQAFHLQPRQSMLQNVALPLIFCGTPRGQRRRRAQAALREVGLTERLEQRVMGLSAGQQQRVAIARAIVNAPQILVADEPTGNLDSETGAQIIDLMDRINHRSNTTLVVATHDPQFRQRAGRTVELQDGQVIEDVRIAHDPPA